jgi:4-hydroxybenzoate polyprenyltransferase
MSVAVSGWKSLRVYLEMIKVEHSIFALPFAMIGMMWGAKGWPGWWVFGWVLLAMVSCRSSAMAFNRIHDRHIDALNDRTKTRALPAGVLRFGHAMTFFLVSIALFLLSAAMLNRLALILSPVALLVTLGYSTTKRFTPLCHFVLGASLGIAPVAAWIASTGRLDLTIGPIFGAVLFWTAGFDIIYALQDVAFDESQKLRSLPQTIGVPRALMVSRICHVLAVVCLAWGGIWVGAGSIYFAGVVITVGLLTYEQCLVKPGDLSKVNLAFFTLNGFVSLGVFAFALIDMLIW